MFYNDRFRDYWGTSNMVLGLFIIVFTVMILLKLRFIENRSGSEYPRPKKKEGNRFHQANRTTMGMLLCSLLFIIMPSVAVGFVEMVGYSIATRIGPFYTCGLLCAGGYNIGL
ncbi:hypothetical protein ANCDUO_02949 [Ancylostoma duodenale]|uniref:Uncharacterized protein n=1 Tax=Ancylostoma duodenale TaxID=51022 RepID=A0A0C2DAI1_9BILA|nr:hypothetical protein ANCDUO_02949 [Ancylostoma duodenale]